jgi:hypothetical protein
MTEQIKYTKEDVKLLIQQFEGMVRALNFVFNEEEIFKLVSMILQNHIQNGAPTPEYLELSREALKMRHQMGETLNPAQRIIVSDFRPRTKKI